jgi:F420-non-reducing hydrogenase large subunit
MTSLTVPLSRIEGHARVVIEFQGSRVLSAHFQATELRGFEVLMQGVPAAQVPVLVPRICGVCSTAHHVAAVKALEDACGIAPPPQAVRIRELMMLGQLIQNQATSLFLFTMPDLPGREGAPSLFHLGEQEADIPPRALAVRRLGTQLITLAGGQFIHPVRAVVGGVTSGLDPQAMDEMRQAIENCLPTALELVDRYWEMFAGLRDRIGTLGDDEPTYYLASVHEGHAYYGDRVRVLAPDGQEEQSFAASEYGDDLTLVPLEASYSDGWLYRGQILRANSLARLNLLPRMGTRRADALLSWFREEWGHPAHAILLFDLARAIELIYCLERAAELLELELWQGPFREACATAEGEGYGLVEAPRGPLIHHYVIEGGLVQRARFLVPTQYNILAIERALEVAARRYITPAGISLELERAVGRVVRAFDPCIACATH